MTLGLLAAGPLCLGLLGAEPRSVADEARAVVAAVVKAAEENAGRGKDQLDGDALADFYVRRASKAATDGGVSAKGFLLGLAVAVDDTGTLRDNLLLRGLLGKVEGEADREKRLKVIGKPTLRGRHDWLLHFAVSAALTSQLGPKAAEQIGLTKELLDSRGGSGFSFADLGADYAGVAFAQRLLDKEEAAKKLLASLAEGFKGDDFLPKLNDLEEGLQSEKLVEKYGKTDDPRFIKQYDLVRERVKQVPGLRPPE